MKSIAALGFVIGLGSLGAFASEEDFSTTFDCSQVLSLDASTDGLFLAWLTGRTVSSDADLNGVAFRGEVRGARHDGELKYELMVLEIDPVTGEQVTRPHPIDPSVQFRVE